MVKRPAGGAASPWALALAAALVVRAARDGDDENATALNVSATSFPVDFGAPQPSQPASRGAPQALPEVAMFEVGHDVHVGKAQSRGQSNQSVGQASNRSSQVAQRVGAQGAAAEASRGQSNQSVGQASNVSSQVAQRAGSQRASVKARRGQSNQSVGQASNLSSQARRSQSNQSAGQASALSSQVTQLIESHSASVKAAHAQIAAKCERDPRKFTANDQGIDKLRQCVRALEAFAKEAREKRKESERLNALYSTMMSGTVSKLHKVVDPKQMAKKLQSKSLEDQQFARTNLMKQVRDVKADMNIFMGDSEDGQAGLGDNGKLSDAKKAVAKEAESELRAMPAEDQEEDEEAFDDGGEDEEEEEEVEEAEEGEEEDDGSDEFLQRDAKFIHARRGTHAIRHSAGSEPQRRAHVRRHHRKHGLHKRPASLVRRAKKGRGDRENI